MNRQALLPLSILLVLLASSPLAAQDVVVAASEIAQTLTLGMTEKGKTKVAVASFRDQSGKATPLGGFLAEEIANQVVAFSRGNLRVVERTRTDAIFEEQRLGLDGLREPSNLDAFVRVLEVDALIVGTLTSLPELGDLTRVHARLIAVPTGEVLTSASRSVRLGSVQTAQLPEESTLPQGGVTATGDSWKTIDFEPIRCEQEARRTLCHLIVTNNDRDRELSFYFHRTYLYDQTGRRFQASSGKVANLTGSQDVEMRLVSGVPTAVTVTFEGLPSGVNLVKLLHLYLYSSEWSSGEAELRNIPIVEK